MSQENTNNVQGTKKKRTFSLTEVILTAVAGIVVGFALALYFPF